MRNSYDSEDPNKIMEFLQKSVYNDLHKIFFEKLQSFKYLLN